MSGQWKEQETNTIKINKAKSKRKRKKKKQGQMQGMDMSDDLNTNESENEGNGRVVVDGRIAKDKDEEEQGGRMSIQKQVIVREEWSGVAKRRKGGE